MQKTVLRKAYPDAVTRSLLNEEDWRLMDKEEEMLFLEMKECTKTLNEFPSDGTDVDLHSTIESIFDNA